MSAYDTLKQIALANNGLILSPIANKNGVSRASLSYLCKQGKIIRIAPGQYILPDNLNDELYSISLRTDLIVFSHETALYLNGISDRTPFVHSVTVPSGKTLSRSLSGQCKVYYIKDEHYNLGKTQKLTPMGNPVPVYDMERTVCDIVRSRSRVADETFIAALKNYADSPDKNLVNLGLYAEKLNILRKVYHYMDVLL